jgi:hypothetical protein
MRSYSADHREWLLADIYLLSHDDYITDGRMFVCPNTDDEIDVTDSAAVNSTMRPVYGADMTEMSTGPDFGILADQLDNHENYGNVLFRRRPRAEFR